MVQQIIRGLQSQSPLLREAACKAGGDVLKGNTDCDAAALAVAAAAAAAAGCRCCCMPLVLLCPPLKDLRIPATVVAAAVVAVLFICQRMMLTLSLFCLLSGHDWHEVSPFFEDLWLSTARCLDDVSDEVRRAAASLGRSLRSLTVAVCSEGTPLVATVPLLQKICELNSGNKEASPTLSVSFTLSVLLSVSPSVPLS